MQQNRTLRQSIRYFFHPVRIFPWSAFFLFFFAMLMGLYNTYTVAFLEYITQALEAGDKEKFLFWIYVILVSTIIYFFLKVFYKPRVFIFRRRVKNYLDNLYLKKFILSDNNDIERIGTGRLISIIGTWVDVRAYVLEEVFRGKVITWSIIISSLYLIGQKSPIFLLITIWVILFWFYWIRYFGKKALRERREVKDASVQMDRDAVRWYMSKFEIQWQNKYEQECNKRDELFKKRRKYKVAEKIYQAYGYDTVVLVCWLVYIVGITRRVGLWVLEWRYSYADFVLMTWLGVMLRRNLFRLQQDIRHTMDSIVHIEKLVFSFWFC